MFKHLETLRERGILTREQDDEDGRRVVWRDDGLHQLSDHGDVDLDSVELEELDDDEDLRQLARNSLYTWEFTNHDESSPHGQSEYSQAGTDGHGEIKG